MTSATWRLYRTRPGGRQRGKGGGGGATPTRRRNETTRHGQGDNKGNIADSRLDNSRRCTLGKSDQ